MLNLLFNNWESAEAIAAETEPFIDLSVLEVGDIVEHVDYPGVYGMLAMVNTLEYFDVRTGRSLMDFHAAGIEMLGLVVWEDDGFQWWDYYSASVLRLVERGE